MNDRTMLRWGIGGAVVAAICCFTPVLVIVFGAVGLSALLGGLDYVLLPALVGFVALAVYALVRKGRAAVRADR
jgi:mercuric ion transport protein